MVRRTLVWLVVALVAGGGRNSAVAQPPSKPTPLLGSVSFAAFDRSGKRLVDLAPSDVTVTVDGTPRRVTALRLVTAGPGADAAAAALVQAASERHTAVHARNERSVLLLVDEASVPRGNEKPMIATASAVLDALGTSDRVAFVRLPAVADTLGFATSRDAVRQQIARISGRAAPVDYLAKLRDQAPASFANDGEGPSQQQRLHDAAREAGSAGETASAGSPLSALAAVERALGRWSGAPDPRFAILLSAGFGDTGTADAATRAALARCVDAAAVAHTVIFALKPSTITGQGDSGLLAQLAQATGGTLALVGRNSNADLLRLTPEWELTYIVDFERTDADFDDRISAIDVSVSRGGAKVRASRRWAVGSIDLPAAIASNAAPLPPVTMSAPTGFGATSHAEPIDVLRTSPRRQVPITDPQLATVLAKASDYVSSYMKTLPNVVSEESYEQRSEQSRSGRSQNLDTIVRRTRADFLMVVAPGVSGWMPFRDVFEVDGKKVRDREDRLQKMFLSTSAQDDLVRDARRLTEESARYNVGSVGRTTNVPTMALAFLTKERVGGLNARRAGDEQIDGLTAWRVDFDEWASPTIMRTSNRSDLPATGTFWIDPLTGRVLRTVLRTSTAGFRSETSVLFRQSETLGFWMPAEMKESYENGTETIKGKATYTNFRRFQVNTDQELKDSKKVPIP